MSHLTMRTVALGLVSVALLTGCGGKQAPGSPSSQLPSFAAPAAPAAVEKEPLPRACELVTEAEAAVVMGQPVGLMGDEAENCIWASAGNPGHITLLMIQVAREATPAEAETMFDSMIGMSGQLSALVNEPLGERTRKSDQELDDLGDAAWRSASNAALIGTEQLVVRKADVVFQLNITGMTKTGKLDGFSERVEAAARRAVDRI